jgi:hypothetical protein
MKINGVNNRTAAVGGGMAAAKHGGDIVMKRRNIGSENNHQTWRCNGEDVA